MKTSFLFTHMNMKTGNAEVNKQAVVKVRAEPRVDENHNLLLRHVGQQAVQTEESLLTLHKQHLCKGNHSFIYWGILNNTSVMGTIHLKHYHSQNTNSHF